MKQIPEDALFCVTKMLYYMSIASGLTLKAIAQKLGEEKIRELYERALDDDVDIFAVAEEEAARHRIELSPVDMSQKERRGIEMGGMVLAFMVIDGNYEPELFPRVLYIMLTIFSDGYGEVSTC